MLADVRQKGTIQLKQKLYLTQASRENNLKVLFKIFIFAIRYPLAKYSRVEEGHARTSRIKNGPIKLLVNPSPLWRIAGSTKERKWNLLCDIPGHEVQNSEIYSGNNRSNSNHSSVNNYPFLIYTLAWRTSRYWTSSCKNGTWKSTFTRGGKAGT